MGDRWHTLLAIDFDRRAAETYRANFPGVDVRCASVGDEVARLPDADVVLGGVPCQPFSDAGNNGGESDARDGFPDFSAAVERVRPRMFLCENVRGLLKARHRDYFLRVLARLCAAGYVVKWRMLDAVTYGVPQFRKRVWIWGIRSDVYAAGVRHAWPTPTHQWPEPEHASLFGEPLATGVTVRQALGLDGLLFRKRSRRWDALFGERPDAPTNRPAPTINCGNADGGSTGAIFIKSHADAPVSIDRPAPSLRSGGDGHDGCCLRAIEYRWSDKMFAKHPPADPDEPSPTVQAKWFKGGAEGLVAVEGEKLVRRLTPLECARLQSAPDDFIWPDDVTKTAAYRIIGNGWASEMARHMSLAMAAADPDARTVIDLYCGGGLGACGWHGRSWRFASPTLANVVGQGVIGARPREAVTP